MLDIALVISFAALVFSGPLAEYTPYGIQYFLLGTCVTSLVLALLSSFRVMIASFSGVPLAILAVSVAAMAVRAGDLPSNELFVLAMLLVILSTVLTGAVYWLVGHFKWGNLIRFIPYPVLGGFLAGTGWLLASGGVEVMCGEPVSWALIPQLLRLDMALRCLPGLLLGLLFLGVQRRAKNPLSIPVIVLLTLLLFYAILPLLGLSLTRAGELGLLLGPFPENLRWKPILPVALGLADLRLLAGQLGDVASIVALSLVSLLLNVSGIELLTRKDVDVNHELKAAGAANVFGGLVGGPIGFQLLSQTRLGHLMGARSRLLGVSFAIMIGLAFLLGLSLLACFPRVIAGGLLLLLGFDLLHEWVVASWRKLSLSDNLVILLILFFMIGVGFLQGIGVGLLISMILFAVNYSRVPVIKHRLTGESFRSNVVRSIPDRYLLHLHGRQIQIFQLQGYVFFGTAYNLFESVNTVLKESVGKIGYLILDFQFVTGIDSSAVHVISKLMNHVSERGIELVVSSMRGHLSGLLGKGHRTEKDLDHAMEWCEGRLIEECRRSGTGDSGVLNHVFEEMMTFLKQQEDIEQTMEKVRPWGRVLKVNSGDVIMNGEQADRHLLFVESGQVTASVEGDRGRVFTAPRGSILGDLTSNGTVHKGFVITADKPSVILQLPLSKLPDIERDDPVTMALLYRVVSSTLSEQMQHLSRTLEALFQ